MRIGLWVAGALVATTPAFAQAPGDTPPAPGPSSPPGPLPGVPNPVPVPGSGTPSGDPAPADVPAPPAKVDPFYGDGPEQGGPSNVAPGDNRHLQGDRAGRDIIVRFHPDRSRNNIIGVVATAGAGVLLGAVGLYFHLDSRDASDRVSADGFTGLTWSGERQDDIDRAERSATLAGVMYGIGGALVLASAVAWIVTEPALETRVIHPHTNKRKPVALVAPSPGGAIVGGAWRF